MNNQESFEIIGTSRVLTAVLRQVDEVAPADTPVLIFGETGTGKELLARYTHFLSPRSRKPVRKICCSGIATDLLESRLFGDEMKSGVGGTVVLDEVGALSFGLQRQLVLALQQGWFGQSGGQDVSSESIRLIVTTGKDLAKAVKTGAFNETLYRQLADCSILVPPLRERKEDIPALVNAFVSRHGAKIGKKVEVIPPQVMDLLQAYNWPGNVLELKNIILRALILTQGEELELEDGLLRP